MIPKCVVLGWLSFVVVGSSHVFVNKCCPFGQGFLSKGLKCVNSSWPWESSPQCLTNTNHSFLVKFIQCRWKYVMKQNETLTVTEDGVERRGGQVIENEYCFESFENENGSAVNVYPVFCLNEQVDETKYDYYNISYMISAIFLLATLLVYVIVIPPRLNSSLVIRYVTASLIAFVLSFVVQKHPFDPGVPLCIISGFAVQFFFLATFFWLNVMCIDIYWAFSGIKLRGTASERDRKKLLAYSFYAWGMPLIILAVTVGVDYSDSIPSSSIFKPNMGKDRCFFKGRTATWTYFYGPMAVILFSNLILFSITAYRIWRHRRETAQSFHRGDSRRHDGNESERFNLYLKLFLVMGINWISELISFMFGKDVPQYLWYITDITNTLQGVFIFLIFVWKKRVRKLLWEKLCGGKQSQLRSSTMTTSTALNSSTR
ncbi:G-protein coupled receptor Mth2-like isoform X5 [Cimex lectularius]|uniref:G-protein coupled receptors family 2 profile 2 domain-containing protein n=1 Tax=Cimex lectularius TaxID=79782 RepID=A0A8I6TJ70_CIMLE|nr:G-protein coupled receptor Mth2-like isoform X5 [Cimex lectularius]